MNPIAIDLSNPPPVLRNTLAGVQAYLKQLAEHGPTTRERVAAIKKDADLSEPAKARQIAEQTEGLALYLDAHHKLIMKHLGEARRAVDSAIAQRTNPDPFALPNVDWARLSAGEAGIVETTRAAQRASAEVARQIAAQRAETLLERSLASDPSGIELAKLREQLAQAGDPVFENAFDGVAALRVTAGRQLLEQAQAAVRESRLGDEERTLLGQLGLVEGIAELLEGVRADVAAPSFLESGRSPVLTALRAAHPELFEGAA